MKSVLGVEIYNTAFQAHEGEQMANEAIRRGNVRVLSIMIFYGANIQS